MVCRYLTGQVYCSKDGYLDAEETWKDISGHPRCNRCSSRVRTKPRSSRLKIVMKQKLQELEIIRLNNAKDHVLGEAITVRELRL